MTRQQAQAIDRFFRVKKHILVLGHRDPDGDCIGSMIAMAEFLRRRYKSRQSLVVQGAVPPHYRFLDPRGRITEYNGSMRPHRWDGAVAIECSSLPRAGDAAELVANGLPLLNIDHHCGNSGFGTLNIVDEEAAACGEQIYDLITLLGESLTPTIAESLAAAILTDTGRFYHACTSPRTLEISGALMRAGADLTRITDQVYYSLSKGRLRLTADLLASARIDRGGRTCFLVLTRALRRKHKVTMPELEGIVDYALQLQTARAGGLIKEMGPRSTKVSLRSIGNVDVCGVARQFGGGGHKNAAGCTLDCDVDEAYRRVLRVLRPIVR